jgi:membrane-associated phospholipid phosphatase
MHADARLLDALAARRYTTVWNWSFRLNDQLIPLATLIGLATGALAFVRRGPRGAAAVAAIICLAIVVAELVKALHPVPPTRSLGDPRAGLDSWPSGHAAVLGALACSLVYVTRGRARFRMAAVAGCWLLLSGLSLLVIRAHRPSDLVGGWLVAGFAAAAVLAIASGRPRDQTE